ncbi:response regulator transcription factor [Alteromonas sp. Cnat2-8]|jgi:DNA-binding NarL/FixJ family response regulator|uniref:response regulator n=2 Tax=unclassified Alteromonas TaxID=2614992 RepID=UPI001EF683F4|nr:MULTISPECIES: response regulator transcription factor [Alteromonas]MCG8497238.1 response regulator transcription factor [Enterobacterales bacterium]MCP4280014.1 response regulator transcription factor [Alteromonas sp.]MEC8638362.1 response regulator transcription factor [Pseudomonadota bacterium]MCG7653026.1 response regulator transcription factor [Alteromonas sp. Cnat2-8]MEC9128311.1 response regulator transcription factor [Pseudomonadota bacterium]|tara:strand:+ start:1498 stop:2142 length:645 start_codon:yes stop_codon:yes gene_type:complete
MKTRLILVEDQMLVREGIKSLLGLDDSVEVVGEYENGQQLIDSENALNCDVILMDIRMPKLSGIDTLLALSDKGISTPVLMLTTFDDHELVNGAMRAGAKGYLLKDVSLETLVDTITQIKNGKTLIQPAVTEKVLQGLKGLNVEFESFENPEPLTEKEVEILRLIAAGYSNKEIADAMFKSTGTIKNQVSSVMAKLGVRDRTRAVLKALEQGIL